MIAKLKLWVFNILLAKDFTLNAWLGGDARETVSSRLWRNRRKWWGRIGVAVVDWVFARLGQKDHCKNSLEPPDHYQNEVLK